MPEDNSHLEPRVARLEVGLETLTKSVNDIATTIRDNYVSTNAKIDQLAIAVTQAAAPKETNWGLFISAIGLILALGAAVLIPLNNATNDNKYRMEAYHTSMVDHQKMDNHPVGEAKINALVKEMDMTKVELVKRDGDLDAKIQKETQLMTSLISANLEALDKRLQMEMSLKNGLLSAHQSAADGALKSHEKEDELRKLLGDAELRVVREKNDLYIEKLFGRVQELEKERIKVADNEHAELMQWRQKAMGLSSPNGVVPIVTREAISTDKAK